MGWAMLTAARAVWVGRGDQEDKAALVSGLAEVVGREMAMGSTVTVVAGVEQVGMLYLRAYQA